MIKNLLALGIFMAVTVTATKMVDEVSSERALVSRGADSSASYTWSGTQCKANPSGAVKTIANTKSKCSNYSKCKYTSTCGKATKDYMWMTTLNSDVNSASCYSGYNYETAYPAAITQ